MLPTGAWKHWESSLDEKVLVGTVNDRSDYQEYKRDKYFELDSSSLKRGWQESLYVALNVTSEVSSEAGPMNGIQYYGRVEDIKVNDGKVRFVVESWQSFEEGDSTCRVWNSVSYDDDDVIAGATEELPELFMKSGEEIKLWRMLRRLTSRVFTSLDDVSVDRARKVLAYQIGHVEVLLNTVEEQIEILQNFENNKSVPLENY